MNKNAGISVTHWMLGFFMFAFVIVGFYVVPQKEFWGAYGYTPNNSIDNLNKASDLDSFSSEISCDVTGIGENDNGVKCSAKQNTVTEFLGFLDNAKSSLLTFFRTIGLFKEVNTQIGMQITYLPKEITQLLTALVITLVVLALVMLAFNRGDV